MKHDFALLRDLGARSGHIDVAAHDNLLFEHCLGSPSYLHDSAECDMGMQNAQSLVEYGLKDAGYIAHASAAARQVRLDAQNQCPGKAISYYHADADEAQRQKQLTLFESNSATPHALLHSTSDQQSVTHMNTQVASLEPDAAVIDYSWDIYTPPPESIDPALLATVDCHLGAQRSLSLPRVDEWVTSVPTPLQSSDRNNRSPTATRENVGKKRILQEREAPGSDSSALRFGGDPAEEQRLLTHDADRGFLNAHVSAGPYNSINNSDDLDREHLGDGDISMLQTGPKASSKAFGVVATELPPTSTEPLSQRPAKRARLYSTKRSLAGGEASSIPMFDGFGDLRNSSDLLVQLDDIEFPTLPASSLQQRPKPKKKVSLSSSTARQTSPSAVDWGIGPAALTDQPASGAALTRVFRRTSKRSSIGSHTSVSTSSTFASGVDPNCIERAGAVLPPQAQAPNVTRNSAARPRGASAFPTPAPSSPGRSSAGPLPPPTLRPKIEPPPFDPDAFAPRRSTHAERARNMAIKHLGEQLNITAYSCAARPEADFVLPVWLAGKKGSRSTTETKIKKRLVAEAVTVVANPAKATTKAREKKATSGKKTKQKELAKDHMKVDEVWPALVSMKAGQTPKAIQCDTCQSWYHLTCVGYKNNANVRDDEEFKCPRCRSSNGQPQRYLYCMRPDCQHGDVPLADDEYFVNRIVGRRPARGGADTEYLIEWAYDDDTTYPLTACTWELASGLDDPSGLIAAFESSAIEHNVDLKRITAPIVLNYTELQPFLDYNHVTSDS